jgi:Mg-chelatase subunit ChlD
MDPSALEKLRFTDEACFDLFSQRLRALAPPPSTTTVAWLIDEVMWALCEEIGFGRSYAGGLLQVTDKAPTQLEIYCRLVREAARTGATLAGILATHLVAVVIQGEPLLGRFLKCCTVMRAKGTYTLSGPLPVLTQLIDAGEIDSALGYLDLLEAVFSQPLSYNPSSRFSYLLPEAVRGFPKTRRQFQIAQLTRVARADLRLIDPYLEGLRKGLGGLSSDALAEFVRQALAHNRANLTTGQAFLALASDTARAAAATLQNSASLSPSIGTLRRYLQARLGRSIVVRSLADFPAGQRPEKALVCSDGHTIYLADEIDHFDRRDQNQALYKTLVALEALLIEAGTYDFDLQRAMDRYPEIGVYALPSESAALQSPCDAQRFFSAFASPLLAEDLFWFLELGRVMRWTARHYPGLWVKTRPLLFPANGAAQNETVANHPLGFLYRRLLLEEEQEDVFTVKVPYGDYRRTDATVETSAAILCRIYEPLRVRLGDRLRSYRPFPASLGWRPYWALLSAAQAPRQPAVDRIVRTLSEHGASVYRADLHRRLEERSGFLSAEDIKDLVLQRVGADGPSASVELSQLDWERLLEENGVLTIDAEPADLYANRYPEWDHLLHDYLRDHVTLFERQLATDSKDAFYADTLERHCGLVARTRRAFELLKPERLKILRPWEEGDDCDYRALLDYAVDRRLRRQPSERLFIKRLKQDRDVAVLLLIDLSRSTANMVSGGSARVIDVAKEALVIFCEALLVVGDSFAVAGFSGSGRHAVHYFPIKDFAEPMTDEVKRRIAALQPQRSTRMGAAIRHAAEHLSRHDARARLLIMVSDGFPNDLGYKGEYAIADTRRAVQEARARHIHVKAITVNIGSDPRLDDLYGRHHHHVIGDVRELPGKLLRLYGTLTRH